MYNTYTKVNAKVIYAFHYKKSGDMKEDSYVGHGEVISHKQNKAEIDRSLSFLTLTKRIIWNLQKYGCRIKTLCG